jgi:hypothetical protein
MKIQPTQLISSVLTIKLVILRLTILVLGLVSSAMAINQPSSGPYAPIEFLAGGVWRGELPAAAEGAKTSIELRCEWTPNHQAIRFDSAFVSSDKRTPYTSGLYVWNAARKQLVLTYCDAEGSLTEGEVFVENKTLRHEFTITDVNGKVSRARALITPQSQNDYTNQISAETGGIWKKLVTVSYHRSAGDNNAL